MADAQRKKLIGCSVALLLLLGFGAGFVLIAIALIGDDVQLPSFGPRVAVVEVFGVIGDEDEVLEQLDAIEDDDSVRAVVLHINSPGGGVAATQHIVDRIQSLKADGLPVVASLETVAASGGYYIACTADSILSLPGTLTGSIGAIMLLPEASALLTKLGIRFQVVKTGPYKDFGGFHRPMSEVERGWIETVLGDVLEQFVGAVDRGRPELASEQVIELADGRIFTGQMAIAVGLADRIGTLEDAVRVAGRLGDIEGQPRVVRRRPRRGFWERLAEERFGALTVLRDVGAESWPRLEYRWR